MYLEHGQSPPQQLSWQQQMVQTQLRRQEQQIIQLRTMQARGLNDYVPPPVYHTINNPVVHSFNYTNPFPAAPRINAGVTSVPNNLTMLVNNANIQPAPALSNNNSIVKNTPIMQNTQLQAPLLNSVVLPQQTLSSTTYNLSPTYDQHINATNTALHLSTSSALANNNANIHQLDGNSAGSNIVAPYLNINKPILSSSIGGGGISSSSPIIDNSKTESFSLIEPKANNLGKLMSVETKKSMRKAWDSAIKKQKKLRAQYLRQNKRDVPTMSIYGGKKTSNFTSAFTRRTNIKPPVRNVGRGMMQPSNSSLRYVKKKRVKNTFKNVKKKRTKNTFKNVQKKRVNSDLRFAVNAMWNLMQVKKIKYQTDRSVGLLMIARSVHKDSHLLLTKIESMNKENPNVISDYTCKFYTEQGKEEGVGPKSERLKAGTRIKVKLNEWKTWHRGYVDKVRGVKYDIDFDDGERRTNVKRNQIRVLGNGYSKKNNHVRKHVNDGADDLVNRKATRKPRWNDDISSDDEDIVYSSTERDATNLESDDEDNNIKTNRRSKGPDNSIWQNICRTEVQKVDDSILADLTYTNAWSLIDIRYLVNAARCHYHFNDVVKHLKKTPNSIFLKFRRMLKKVPTLSLKTLKAVLNEKHKVKYRIKNDWKKSQIQTLVKLRKEGKSFEEIGRILGKTYRLCYHKFKGLGKKYPKLKRYLFSLKRRKDKDEKMRTAKLNPTDEQLEETANYSWTVRQMKRMIAAIQNGHSFETCAATFKNPKRTTNAFKRKYERLVEKFGEIEED